ncbi:DNA-3-methyladenine glycosylase [Paenibacillus sp. R14(2021)]|uniref:DNA-3-methyladenine glycosylase family protein n=1 Tax=Paenibacillus sp. R14(2021) TaxID=2859228 RepID=UPI001C614585|nr:DNA-3-methyladenine glycosylase [Paenibacillus sp. R14(2021)]
MSTTFTLNTPNAFTFEYILDYLARSDKECLFRVADGTVTKLIMIGDSAVLTEVSSGPDGLLHVRLPAVTVPIDDPLVLAVTAYIREWLDMDRDLAPFLALAEQDVILSRAVSQLHGLRLVGIPDLFEALCWGIMGQQINLTFAYSLKRQFVEQFGTSQEWGGHRYWLFPTPERIAAAAPSELTALQFTGRKAEYAIGVAKLMAEGALSRQQLLAIGDWPSIEKALTAIRGIGPWTANYVLMRCLRMPAAFPLEDVGLHNALKLVLNRSEKPSIAEIKQLSAPWGEWKAYAVFYLWRLM